MQRHSIFARYLNPWKFKREQAELQRIAELRDRDGDDCRRCRRAIRFDLPLGHEQAPRIHDMALSPRALAKNQAEGFEEGPEEGPGEGPEEGQTEAQLPSLESLCLVHVRCNTAGADNTAEVKERVQRKNEAELFAKKRA